MKTTIFTLKAAVRSLVQRAGGNTACANAINDVGLGGSMTPSRISDVMSAADDKLGHHLNLAQIAILEAQVGEPIVTAVLGQLIGYRLIPHDQEPEAALANQLLALAAGLGTLATTVDGVEGERSINQLTQILNAGEALAKQVTDLNADVRTRIATQQQELS